MTITDLLSLCSTNDMEQAEFLNTLWYAVSNQIVLTELSAPLSITHLIWLDDYYMENAFNE